VSERWIGGCHPEDGRPLRVRIEDGHIDAVEPGGPGETAWLAPGLVDLQVNGFGGIDLNRPGFGAADLDRLAAVMAATGTTTWVPTLITASEADIVASLRTLAAARRESAVLRHAVPFVHVEGPHISPEDGPRGAHPCQHVRAPDLAEFDRWQAACDGLVGLVTLSPHWPEAPVYIMGLRARGVLAAIGHTHATPAEIRRAVAAGASLSTHLGNGAHAVLPRHPNYIWAQLAADALTATFIADGHHLPGDTLTAMLRAKGLERSILVSDATALAGMAPGLYDAPIGGRVELTADGRLGVAGTPYLAGAAKALADDVACAIGLAGLEFPHALRLATANPGSLAGGRGILQPGATADLVRFHWQPGAPHLAIDTVLAQGRVVG
jgi:N-acetylglucosamine-6-phosphate deacetylase